MEKVKIKSIKQIGDGFLTDSGNTIYTFGVILEDDRKVVANSTTTEPWWSTGVEADMELKGKKTQNGTEKVGFKRPESNSQGNGYNYNQSNVKSGIKRKADPRGIEIGQAGNLASNILCASEIKENGLNYDTFPKMFFELTRDILQEMDRIRDLDANGTLFSKTSTSSSAPNYPSTSSGKSEQESFITTDDNSNHPW